MGGALKIVVLVVGGIMAAKWLSQEEYGQPRYQRIMQNYIGSQAVNLVH